MAFFTPKPSIIKSKVLNHYMKRSSLLEDPQLISRYRLEKERKKYTETIEYKEAVRDILGYQLKDTEGNLKYKTIRDTYTRREKAIDTFGRKILERAIKYTPIENDELHNKKHPTEPHLKDAYKYKRINLDDLFNETHYEMHIHIINTNSYAAIVHEDYKAHHEAPTSSNYLMRAALEISAEYNNPFYIYFKVGPENVELYIKEYKEKEEGFVLLVDGYDKIDELKEAIEEAKRIYGRKENIKPLESPIQINDYLDKIRKHFNTSEDDELPFT